MTEIRFRWAEPTDAQTLEAITRAAYAKWTGVIGRNPRPVDTDYDKAIVEHLIVVVELNGRCIGLLELHVLPDHLLLENIAILPEVQGFGVGPRALSHAEEIACSLQKGAIRLYTNKAFTTNLAFYAKHGFSETREEMLPDGGLLVHFEKKVAVPRANALASEAARALSSTFDDR